MSVELGMKQVSLSRRSRCLGTYCSAGSGLCAQEPSNCMLQPRLCEIFAEYRGKHHRSISVAMLDPARSPLVPVRLTSKFWNMELARTNSQPAQWTLGVPAQPAEAGVIFSNTLSGTVIALCPFKHGMYSSGPDSVTRRAKKNKNNDSIWLSTQCMQVRS